MNRFKTSISNLRFDFKPSKNEIGKISKSFSQVEVSISELANYLENGHTFAPAVFTNNERKNSNFKSSQIFALDFDDNQNIDERVAYFKEFGIVPNIVYESFSSTPEHKKFRLVIVLDTTIEDIKLQTKIQLAFMNIAKDCDVACKDVARMFLGTNKKVIVHKQEANKLTDILPAIDMFMNSKVSEPIKRKNTEKLQKLSKNVHSYNNIYKDVQKMKLFDKILHYDFKTALQTSKVLNGFYNGKHLKYRQLLVLATNMYYIKGGIKWMKAVMDRTGTYKDEDYQLLSVCSRYNYLPMDITDFDADLIDQHKNLLTIDKDRQGVTILKPIEKVDVEVVANNFSKQMEIISNREILNSNYNAGIKSINVLKASVGIGKTKKIIRQKNILIAVPSHKLKDELAERMKAEGIEHITTPEIPIFNNNEINTQYEFYSAVGDTKKANQLIKDLAADSVIKNYEGYFETEDDIRKEQDILLATEYLRKLKECYNSDKTVITTHRRAILSHKSFNKKHIVFDEDITKELLPIVEFKRSHFKTILEQIKSIPNKVLSKQFEADIRAIIKNLDLLPNSIIKPSEKMVFNNESLFIKELSNTNGGEKIIKFLNSQYVVKYTDLNDVEHFYGISKVELPEDLQITIVSATADKWICDKLIKDYDFHNLGIAKNLKPIIQYTNKAFTRKQIRNNELPNLEDNKVVITYKSAKDKFELSDKEIHFGNTAGYDTLAGCDLSIVGTPVLNPIVTMLYAKALDLDYTNQEKEYRTIVLDTQYRFPIFTYVDDNLANIEIRLAQSELEQAVGRSRSSRFESNVDLFSSIPIPSTDVFKIRKK